MRGAKESLTEATGGRRCLVDAEPVTAQILERSPERGGHHGLLDHAVGSQMIALRDLARLRGRRQHDHGSGAGPGAGADRAKHVEAIEPGQLDGEQDEAGHGQGLAVPERAAGEQKIERLLAVAGHADAGGGTDFPERSKGDLHFEGIVVHEEDVHLVGQRHRLRPPKVMKKVAPVSGSASAHTRPP